MPTHRQSDENSNPDYEQELNPQNTVTLIKSENKPLLPSNEASSSKRRLSTFERKERDRFVKSGMKKGSLLKYFVKENPEAMHNPSPCRGSSSRSRNRSLSRCTDNENGVSRSNQNESVINEANGAGENLSQGSEIECLGVIPRNKEISEDQIVAISSDSDDSVSPEEFDAESPQVSEYDDEDESSVDHKINGEESVINHLDDQELSSEDKIERWQSQNKRMLQDVEQVPSSSSNELQPPPAKSTKLDVPCGEMIDQEDNIFTPPEKSQGSNTSTPPLRIVNVYTLSNNNKVTPSTSTASSTSFKSAGDKAKKTIFIYKEIENCLIPPLIEKKNWRKILDLISKDLQNYKLPTRLHMSQLIRQAILCEGARVSKDVQSESIKLLEELIKTYPPHNGNGRDPSVKYYKEILEKVFDKESDADQGGIRNKLYLFLLEIHKRLVVEKNALDVLVIVTQMVVNQYEVYEKEAGVKVKPPLFQYFLEATEAVFTYNSCCQHIVNNCCSAATDEEFCIYIKWVDLIAQRLGKFPVRQKEYQRMVKDFANKCAEQKDLGLILLLNISYKPFSILVCETIFERLKVVHSNSEEDVIEQDRRMYLMKLSETLLIKPAVDIVTDVVEEVCKLNANLVLHQLRADTSQTKQANCDNQNNGRKKNVKGETRLHILCRPGQDNPVPDIRKHLAKHPDDVNAKDNFGNTPLHDCAKNNKGNIIVALMELHGKKKLKEIDFLARNESWETPMHLAATYCDARTTEIFIYFAKACGVFDQVLTTANGNGKLPFQVAPAKSQVIKKLTPSGYDRNAMLTHQDLTLDKDSVDILEKNFDLRKLLALWSYWSQKCM